MEPLNAALTATFQYVSLIGVGGLLKSLLNAALTFAGAINKALTGNVMGVTGVIAQVMSTAASDVGGNLLGNLFSSALTGAAFDFTSALEKGVKQSSDSAKSSFTAALTAAAGIAMPTFQLDDVTGAGKHLDNVRAGIAAMQKAGAATVGGTPQTAAAAAIPSNVASGWNPMGLTNAAAAAANRVSGMNFSSVIGARGALDRIPGMTSARDAGWGGGGLLTGAAYDQHRAQQREAARKGKEAASSKGAEVTAPKMEEHLAAIRTSVAALDD